ncbi:MAG: hypothetical protein WKG07_01355 [Hymenobacter sp.]
MRWGTLRRATKAANEYYTIAGQRFAQYAKFDLELREYYRISPKSTSGNRIVGRLQLGIGLPYGNSAGGSMPYLAPVRHRRPQLHSRPLRPVSSGRRSYKPAATDDHQQLLRPGGRLAPRGQH